MPGEPPLRLLSYLSPSVPERLFVKLAAHLAASLGSHVELDFDASRSGPRPGEPEPFSSGEADVAFVCATSYVWMTSEPRPAVELAGAAWVPTDPRAGGRPVYFGDVLVGAGGPSRLEDLAGLRVAYNDEVSLSGYHSVRLALAAVGIGEAEVDWHRSGSHLASLDLLTTGQVGAAAVDSNVWRRLTRARSRPHVTLRTITTLGPHPTQPVVVRRDLDPRIREAVAACLLNAMSDDRLGRVMRDAELSGFAAVTNHDFAILRAQLTAIR